MPISCEASWHFFMLANISQIYSIQIWLIHFSRYDLYLLVQYASGAISLAPEALIYNRR